MRTTSLRLCAVNNSNPSASRALLEPGAICAAVALLVVFSLPAYAKNGGSSSAHTRVGKTSTNVTSVKPVTSSRKTQSGTLQKSGTVAVQPKSNSKIGAANKTKKEVDAIKGQLAPNELQIKDTMQKLENTKQQEQTVKDNIQSQQDKSGNIQKNLDAAADKQREMGNTIICLANC
jgi:hypothetical protein